MFRKMLHSRIFVWSNLNFHKWQQQKTEDPWGEDYKNIVSLRYHKGRRGIFVSLPRFCDHDTGRNKSKQHATRTQEDTHAHAKRPSSGLDLVEAPINMRRYERKKPRWASAPINNKRCKRVKQGRITQGEKQRCSTLCLLIQKKVEKRQL